MATVFWAAAASAAKFLFNSGITPFQLVQLRITISAFFLFLWLLMRSPHMLKISLKDLLSFIILGALGMATLQFAYLFTISKINVAAAILLQYLAPIFIALYAMIFSGEKPGRTTITAMFLSTFGCYLAVGAYNPETYAMNLVGIIGGICTALSYAWFALQGEHLMRKYNPWTVLFFALFFASFPWNMIHPPMEAFAHLYSPIKWALILGISILGTILPYGLFYEGIKIIRSTRASITATLEPIIAGIISFIFLGEILEPLQLLGGAVVIAAVIVLQSKKRSTNNAK